METCASARFCFWNLLAQPLQRSAHPGGRHPVPGVHVRDPLHFVGRKAGRSGNFHFPDVRLLAAVT